MTERELNRTLGVPMLVFYGTGMILGAGIYSIIGKAAAHTGETLWISFLLAAFVAFLTACSYAELSSMFPKAGAEYVYLNHAFPTQKWIGSTVGASMAFAGIATATTVGVAFSGYFAQFLDWPRIPVAVGMLMILGIVALVGVRISGWTNVVFTLIEMAGLILIVVLGLRSDQFGEAFTAIPHSGTLSGAALVVFSYFGFENIVNLAEEARKPEKALPRAIFLSLLISSVLYFGVSLGALALLSVDALAGSEAALMTAAQSVSEKWGRVLGAIALFSTANTALISMVGSSRVIYGMSKGGAVPMSWGHVSKSSRTPWVATLIVFTLAILMLPLGDVEVLAGISSFATMVAFFMVNLAVIRLRRMLPDQARGFRSPLSFRSLPLLALLGMLMSAVFLTQLKIVSINMGLMVLLIASGFFLIRQRFSSV